MIVAILLMAILVAGCSYTNNPSNKAQMYMGDKLNRDETAIIRGGGHFGFYYLVIFMGSSETKATIHKVDGQIVEIKKDVPNENPEGYLFSDPPKKVKIGGQVVEIIKDVPPKEVVVNEADQVEVLPGFHEVELIIKAEWGFSSIAPGNHARLTRHLIFNFEAKAGHTYTMKPHTKITPLGNMKSIIVNVTDEQTKEVIASKEVDL